MQNELTGPKSIFNRSRRHDKPGEPTATSAATPSLTAKAAAAKSATATKAAISCQKLPKVAKSRHQLPTVAISCQKAYLIIVIFFTLTQFLENKIYTQKTRKLRQNTQ